MLLHFGGSREAGKPEYVDARWFLAPLLEGCKWNDQWFWKMLVLTMLELRLV
jgi:hypothetical protein